MRIISIEVFRIIAIIAVIFQHTAPFGKDIFSGVFYDIIKLSIAAGVRFAVPCFFIISGYFVGKRIRAGNLPKDILLYYSKRCLLIFLFWSIVYVFLITDLQRLSQYGYFQIVELKLRWLLSHPLILIFRGGKVHLWFLMSLAIAIFIVTASIHFKITDKIIFVLALSLYVFGLLAGSYSSTPIGFEIPFNTRNGPFFSTIFVFMGWYLSSEKYNPRTFYILTIIFLGYLLFFLEILLLKIWFNISIVRYDYSISTIIYCPGIVLFMLSLKDKFHNLNNNVKNKLLKISRLTLGVYVSHYLFVDLLKPLGYYFMSFVWEALFPIVVYCASLPLTYLMSKNSLLKRTVW